MGKDKKNRYPSAVDNKTRAEQESSEPQGTTSVDAPAARFQGKQQTAKAADVQGTNVPASSMTPKKLDKRGSQLKQEVASDVILESKGVGGYQDVVSGADIARAALPFSGDSGTILGSAAGTPIMDRDIQGRSRVDKKMSDVNKKIDYLVSEQVTVDYTQIPSLSESPDSVVGYNGNPKNIAVRMQKRSGNSSADLLYDRSLDLLEKDSFVFSTGQVVKQSGVDYQDYPTRTYNPTSTEPAPDENGYVSFGQTRGNFSPRNIVIKFNRKAGEAAYVSGFAVEEDDFSITIDSDTVVNRSAANEIIDVNRAELARQRIDSDAGSPSDEFFNPLGRSTDQPSRTVLWAHDQEAVAGAEIFTSYKFGQKARGYYLNRASKDGQDLIGPALDALYGHLLPARSSKEITKFFGATPGDPKFFNKNGMAAGSAAVLPHIFDSARKYQTKADFVTQPKGFRLCLQTADNTMNPFRVSKGFIAALNSIDAFSTIGRGYDAMSTVEILDNVRLVHPYSWAKSLAFTREQLGGPRVYSSQVMSYVYAAGKGQNMYQIRMGDPLLNGIAWFAEQHAGAIYAAISGSSASGEVTWTIPVVHSTTHFSLWDYLVCVSVPYIVYERTNTMKDILDYEKHFGYPFQDLVDIGHANPMNAVNYGNSSALEPLEVRQMMPSSALRWILPEVFRPTDAAGDHALAPWYFSEDQIEHDSTSKTGAPVLRQTDDCNFSMPVIRDGIRLAGLDSLYDMEVKDVMLCLDMLTTIPGSVDGDSFGGAIYKYSRASEGIPIIAASGLTAKSVHSTPRMLGWFMDAYAGECCAPISLEGSDDLELSFYKLPDSSTLSALSTSFRAIAYRALNYGMDDSASRTVLGAASNAISRAQAFVQEWLRMDAIRVGNNDAEPILKFPITLSLAAGFSTLSISGDSVDLTDRVLMTPAAYTRGGSSVQVEAADGYTMISLHDIFWGVIQKLPFILNPFDVAYGAGCFVDPFSVAYIFGLAGFMAADYNEYVYNRETEKINKAYGFVNDPFLLDSPLFKEAVNYTEL